MASLWDNNIHGARFLWRKGLNFNWPCFVMVKLGLLHPVQQSYWNRFSSLSGLYFSTRW